MQNHPTLMKRIVSALAGVAFLAAQAAIASAAVVPPAEKLLPEDTLAMFTVPDFVKAREIYDHSPQGQLLQDPCVKAFKEKFLAKLRDEFITPLERDMGIKLDDYTSLPQGQVTIAVTQNGWSGKPGDKQEPGLLLLVDTKDKGGQLSSNLADLRKKWVDAGKTVRTEKISGVDFSIVSISTNDLPKSLRKSRARDTAESAGADLPPPLENPDAKKSPAKQDIYVGQADALLIVADSSKGIEKVLARLSGGEVRTIGDVPSYDANHSTLFRDAAAFGWVNAKFFVDMLSHSDDNVQETDSAKNPFSFKMEKLVAALGLNGLKSIALSYRFSEDGAQGTLFLSVPESSRVGLFKILAGEGKESTPPPFVPADAIKFQRWRIDGHKAWESLRQMVSEVSPQSLGGIDFMLGTAEAAAKEKDPGFDLKKGLFGNLGDDIVTYSKAPKNDSATELNSAPSLILIASPNAEQLSASLRNVLPLLAQAPTEREFRGRKIYSIALPSPKGASAGSLNYSFSGGYLAISTDNAILEEYLRSTENQGKSLRETPGLTEAAQKIGGGNATMFGYSNDGETMRTALETIKKLSGSAEALGAVAPSVQLLGGAQLKDWFDLSLLPAFDQISKYFSFTVYAETAGADGIAFKAFTPTPPQLRK